MKNNPYNLEAEEAVNGSLLIGAVPAIDLSLDDFLFRAKQNNIRCLFGFI